MYIISYIYIQNVYIFIFIYFIMNRREKIKNISINIGTDSRGFLGKLSESKIKNDFSNIEMIRMIFSKERIRLISLIKDKKPNSIYELSKIAKKDFKIVHEDLNILKNFGIISLKPIKNGNRESIVPTLEIEQLNITVKF